MNIINFKNGSKIIGLDNSNNIRSKRGDEQIKKNIERQMYDYIYDSYANLSTNSFVTTSKFSEDSLNEVIESMSQTIKPNSYFSNTSPSIFGIPFIISEALATYKSVQIRTHKKKRINKKWRKKYGFKQIEIVNDKSYVFGGKIYISPATAKSITNNCKG